MKTNCPRTVSLQSHHRRTGKKKTDRLSVGRSTTAARTALRAVAISLELPKIPASDVAASRVLSTRPSTTRDAISRPRGARAGARLIPARKQGDDGRQARRRGLGDPEESRPEGDKVRKCAARASVQRQGSERVAGDSEVSVVLGKRRAQSALANGSTCAGQSRSVETRRTRADAKRKEYRSGIHGEDARA